MAGKLRPSLRAKTIRNVMERSNLSDTDKKCIQDVFESYKNTSEWISVKDRLPEDGQLVLVWHEYFRFGEYNRLFQTYEIGYQFQGHWSMNGQKVRAIAWMPLPEPPKEEE